MGDRTQCFVNHYPRQVGRCERRCACLHRLSLPNLGPGAIARLFFFYRSQRMGNIIQRGINDRRSIETALADLLAKYERFPSTDLARMIRQLQAEIANASALPEAQERVSERGT